MKKFLAASVLFVGCIGSVAFPAIGRGGEIVLQSQPQQRASLLELYTSEGCSSCPPADAWLSALKNDSRLWKGIVPVAFHVDYWNNLGWKDRFSSAAFTARQRLYSAQWGTSSVYTPGFVLDGKEWEWNRSQPPDPPKTSPGTLTATVAADRRTVSVSYQPNDGSSAQREAHVAILGFGLKSAVRAGENQGRDLKHDFVVLSCEEQPLAAAGAGGKSAKLAAIFHLPEILPSGAERFGVAAWVTRAGSVGVEQAAGGWADVAPASRADRKTAKAGD